MEKIDKAIKYYSDREKEIIDRINIDNNLSVNYIIKIGIELNEIGCKISALEIAKNN